LSSKLLPFDIWHTLEFWIKWSFELHIEIAKIILLQQLDLTQTYVEGFFLDLNLVVEKMELSSTASQHIFKFVRTLAMLKMCFVSI
jgi:hypothetical protein